MANVDRKNGFRPVKSLIGAPWTSLVRSYPAVAGRSATNNSGDIYIGDVVKLSASGNVEPATAVTDAVVGVVVATGNKASVTALNTDNNTKYYDPDNLSKRYLAYDEDGYVGVVPAEACLFSVQSSETDKAQGSTGAMAILTTAARGSRTTGNSMQSIGAGTGVTVVEQEVRPDNDTTLANARYIVKFDIHANPIN